MRDHTKGILLMLEASVSFALMAAATKFTAKTVPVTEIVFVRSLGGAAVIGWLLAKAGASWKGKEPPLLLARGTIGFIAMFLYFWAISRIDLGTAVMLNYTAPIFAVLAAHLFLRETSSPPLKTALLLSFAGVYLVSAPQFPANAAGLLAGLLSGLLAGTVHVLIRYSHEEESPLTIIFYFTAISAAGSGLLLLKSGVGMPSVPEALGLLAVTATSLIGQLTITNSLRTAPISIVSPFGYLTPVLGLYLGWLVWGESPTPMGLAGSAVIIACGMFLYGHLTKMDQTPTS